jgi:hypothetical protein
MPIAGVGMTGLLWQEIIIKFGLISLSLSMITVCLFLLWGIKSSDKFTE